MSAKIEKCLRILALKWHLVLSQQATLKLHRQKLQTILEGIDN